MSELIPELPVTSGAAMPAVHGRRTRRVTTTGVLASGFLAIVVLVTLLVPFVGLPDPNAQDLSNPLAPISSSHWLGTDELGRDMMSRLLWGTHRSFLAALTAMAVAVAVGLPLGLIAGYRRGWVDQLLSRGADVVLTVPALILLLAAQTALDTGIQGQMVVLGMIFAPRIMRVVRTETLRVRAAPYVAAGRMSGASHSRIVLRYLLPGVRPQFVVQTSYLLGLALVVEAGISFLGVGVRPPDASLGSLLSGAAAMLTVEPRLVLVPATVLTLLILSLNVLGDMLSQEKKS